MNDADRPALSRRAFLGSGLALAAAAAVAPRFALADAAAGSVVIVDFDDAGKVLGAHKVAKVVKPDAQWRGQLSPLAFAVTRHAATERPFSGALLNEHGRGLFRCACCGTALFDSRTKFESGTGWPSFWKSLTRHNVHETEDRTLGMVRTSVECARCDAHLGHVFDDGPRPTGLRSCMNSVSLTFHPAPAGTA